MSKLKIEEEIKFKELLKNPLRLFGLSYFYFFVVVLLIGIFYVKNIERISYNTVPVSYIDSLNIDRDIPEKKGGSMPAVDLKMISNPTEVNIAKGKELFNANCKSCHGEQGNGDGPAGAALNPKPRNFHQKEGWTNGNKFSEMYKTLQEGITKNGMAAYEYIPAADRISIIHYIRSLDQFPKIDDNEVSMLDATYNLSQAVEMPNQIPVKKAIEKIISETPKSDFDKINSEIKNILVENSVNPQKTFEGISKSAKEKSFDEFLTAVFLNPSDFYLRSNVKKISKNDWQKVYSSLSKVE
jgi:mono/diheme cytochrome c family protein